MRKFNSWEKSVLDKIAQVPRSTTIPIKEWLEQNYFKENDGRALIIQAKGGFAVFFLDLPIYNNKSKRDEEIIKFLELISLLLYLKEKGYISIYRGLKIKRKEMFFIQDRFIDPVPKNNNIILNAKGEYTSGPDTIHDKDHNIVYKGEYFDLESFEMILNITTGLMYVSETITELINDIDKNLSKEIINKAEEKMPGKSEKKDGKIKPLKCEVLQSKEHRKTKFNILKRIKGIIFFIMLLGVVFPFYFQSKARYSKINKELDEVKQFINNVGAAEANDKNIIYGIDLSHWNGDALDEIENNSDLSFVICKATEGSYYIDSQFKKNWSKIKNKGLTRGAYHFFIAEDDPVKQAELFINTLKSLDSTDIAPIIDIEEGSLPIDSKVNKFILQKNLLVLLNEIEEKVQRTPIIYTNLAFGNKFLTRKVFANYPLWIAHYSNDSEPTIPAVWKDKGWRFWQKSSTYDISNKKVDFDVFYGNKEDLYK